MLALWERYKTAQGHFKKAMRELPGFSEGAKRAWGNKYTGAWERTNVSV